MELADSLFEPCACTLCGADAAVKRYSRPRTALAPNGATFDVTEVFRRCDACNAIVTNTKDHDWRAEFKNIFYPIDAAMDCPPIRGVRLVPVPGMRELWQ